VLEDITLHPQLGVLPLELSEPSPLVDTQAFPLAPLHPVTVDSVAQRAVVDAGLVGLLED
jgi:hypothetical protein